MTIIEFFDGVSINNMASCLTIKPDKIIFIGEKKPMKKQEDAYLRLVNSYGIDVEFDYRSINKNSIVNIMSVLTEIVESEESCVFDLTGGEDLVLVAMGIVFEKYKNTKKIQMHRFNVKTGVVYDCDSDGVLPDFHQPEITVKDNIMLYGGCIVPYNGDKGTYNWVIDEDFENDLKTMWNICKKNPGLWNSQIGTLSFISKIGETQSSQLDVSVSKAHLQNLMKNQRCKFVWIHGLIESFQKYGLISNLVEDETTISFNFKNEQVKLCLTKEGTVLEMVVLLFAKYAKEKDGSLKYNDAVNGVYIDWDSTIHDVSDEEKDTENEVDVVLMKGLVPIFISCKNGYVDETELYKLNTVAERFGGIYAQKVLVASYFGKGSAEGHKYFVQRAKDMKILLIENVHELSESDFSRKIKNII